MCLNMGILYNIHSICLSVSLCKIAERERENEHSNSDSLGFRAESLESYRLRGGLQLGLQQCEACMIKRFGLTSTKPSQTLETEAPNSAIQGPAESPMSPMSIQASGYGKKAIYPKTFQHLRPLLQFCPFSLPYRSSPPKAFSIQLQKRCTLGTASCWR